MFLSGSDPLANFSSHRLKPEDGSWCIEALAAANPEQVGRIFGKLSMAETFVLLKTLNPPLRVRVIRNLPLTHFMRERIERSLK